MPAYKIKTLYSHLLNILFPERQSGRRSNFDFSAVLPRQLAKTLPKARQPPKSYGPIIACLSYENPIVRALVWHIKTKRDRYAFACGGYVLAKKICEIAPQKTILIPMPINRKRRRERGYNQCELLAREIERYTLARKRRIEIRDDILFRNNKKEQVKKQAFKNRSERISGMKDAFSVRKRSVEKIENVSLRRFIIIDDVVTTGSTMREAIETLRKAGCKNVSGIALAH